MRANAPSLRALHDRVAALSAASEKAKAGLTMTDQVIDALATRSATARHNRIARLPITKEIAAVGVDGNGQTITLTTYSVKGTPKLRVEQVWPRNAAPSYRSTSGEILAFLSAMSGDELPCYEDCGGESGGGDPPASQQDRDDTYAMLVALDYEMETVASETESAAADFDAWWTLNHPSIRAAGAIDSRLLTDLPFQVAAQVMEGNPCTGYRAVTVGSFIAYASVALSLSVALFFPPTTLPTLIGLAGATVGSGVVFVGVAQQERQCHADND